MPTLILIRHGQSAHHVNGMTGGWTDSPLTARGRQQATLLAARLTSALTGRALRLISSDLTRTRQTAEIIGAPLGLPAELAPALREYNNGRAAGLTRTAARTLRQSITHTPLDGRPFPEAESWREFYQRVTGYLTELTRELTVTTLLVTHFGTINNIVVWWLQLPIHNQRRPWTYCAVDPTSLTVLQTNSQGEHVLGRLNDTAHLAGTGLSDWGLVN
ncbi:MAG: histidine phosphatase family protein [Chloroflexota bacterium]|nr:histidine phosphatase family protein [Chloroflexota bacterium]